MGIYSKGRHYIGMGLTKKSAEKSIKELRKKGYLGLRIVKAPAGRYYDILYRDWKKPKVNRR